MSDEFHVHGAHEHEVEHQAMHGVGLAQYVAIFTAILSSFAAVISYHSASMQNDAMLLKNEAVIKQSQASDTWAFYQAKSNKGHLMELASQLVPDKAAQYKEQLQRYEHEKQVIQTQAKSLEAQSAADDLESNRMLATHHQQAQGMMLLQIAISLASITALTRKRWLFILAGTSALVGAMLSIVSWMA